MSFDDHPRRPALPATFLGANDDAARAPHAEALLAAALALMTGVVERAALNQPLADHAQSLLMATKVRAHLHSLSALPQMSPGFRTTAARLCAHWDRLAGVAPAQDRPLPPLWMPAPTTLQ